MSDTDKQPFRGKVKYNEDGTREEIPAPKNWEYNKDKQLTPIDNAPEVNWNNSPVSSPISSFVNEIKDSSGIPIINADGQLESFEYDETLDALAKHESELRAASEAHLESDAAAKAITKEMLERVYASEAIGRTTDEVEFKADGTLTDDSSGWLRVPANYTQWLIHKTLTMAVMPIDSGIGILSDSELKRGVTDNGHPIFPVVLSCLANKDTRVWDLYQYLDDEFCGSFAIMLDQEMISGDGMGRPMGLFPKVTMRDEAVGEYKQSVAPPNVKNVQLINVKPGEEAILDIGMLIALDLELEDALGSKEASHVPAVRWYFNSSTGLKLATMKDAKGNFMLKQDTPAMKMIGIPDTLAGHEIVYNEWMDDFYPGLVPIILGDIGKAYEVKIAPQLFIKRFSDADEEETRVYGLGFYMAAGVNLHLSRPTDGSEGELPLPYVGLVIDGRIEDFEDMVQAPDEVNLGDETSKKADVVVTQLSQHGNVIVDDVAVTDDKSVDSTLLATSAEDDSEGVTNEGS